MDIQPVRLDDGVEFNPPSDCTIDGRCRDMFYNWEFIYICIIPAGIIILLAYCLAIIMCCGSSMCRCKCVKKNKKQDEEYGAQLLRYNSIRRASMSLRHLSRDRESAIGSCMTLDRGSRPRRPKKPRDTCSLPGTLERPGPGRYMDTSTFDAPPVYSYSPHYSQQQQRQQRQYNTAENDYSNPNYSEIADEDVKMLPESTSRDRAGYPGYMSQ